MLGILHLMVYHGQPKKTHVNCFQYSICNMHLQKLSLFGVQVFAQLLCAPEEADLVDKKRFPVPRLFVCDQYGFQVIFST